MSKPSKVYIVMQCDSCTNLHTEIVTLGSSTTEIEVVEIDWEAIAEDDDNAKEALVQLNRIMDEVVAGGRPACPVIKAAIDKATKIRDNRATQRFHEEDEYNYEEEEEDFGDYEEDDDDDDGYFGIDDRIVLGPGNPPKGGAGTAKQSVHDDYDSDEPTWFNSDDGDGSEHPESFPGTY